MLNVTAPGLEKILSDATAAFAKGDYAGAHRKCAELLKVAPRHVVGLTLLAGIAMKNRQWQAAVELADRAILVDAGYADAHYQRGVGLMGMGRLEEAVESYQRAVKIREGFVEAWFSLGIALRRSGKTAEAVAALRRVVEMRKGFARGFNELGSALKDMGKRDEAIECYQEAVRIEPGFADAFYNMGVSHGEEKRIEEAMGAYEKALRLRPMFPEALANLGAALERVGRLRDALGVYKRSLDLMPKQEQTWFRYGVASIKARRFKEAVSAFQRVTQENGKRADAWHALALALQGNGNLNEAIAACQTGAALETCSAAAHLTLAALLVMSGKRTDASEVLRAALQKWPDVEELAFQLAMLSEERDIRKLPTSVVYSLFENYAPMFEKHLVKGLSYKGPEWLMEGVEKVSPEGRFDILDVGCGTGLCGALFKAKAKKMVGVDLAQGMVQRAAARGIYDEVFQGELVSTMLGRKVEFDLVLAGDVFEYVGDLDEVFAAAKETLRDDGLFAFTVEKSEETEMVFQATVRFAHSLSYVRAMSGRHGFAEMYVEERVLRTEKGKPLMAWVVILRKA